MKKMSSETRVQVSSLLFVVCKKGRDLNPPSKKKEKKECKTETPISTKDKIKDFESST